MIKNRRGPSILQVNILYLVVGIARITLGASAQSRNIYTGLLITEYIIILLPSLLFMMFNGYPIKQTLRLNGVNLKQIILVILIVLFSYPIAVFFNFIGLIILDKFSQVMTNPVPIPSTANEYFIGFMIIALTPGLCEEVLFRGIIMSAYDRLGRKKAIIYSSILFGIFHFNAQNLLGPIFLGILFGVIAYRTDSLIATIIGHTTNNTIALTIGYAFTKLEGEMDAAMDAAMDGMIFPETNEVLLAAVGLGIIGLVFGIIVYSLIKKLPPAPKIRTGDLDGSAIEELPIQYEDMGKDMGILNSIPVIIVMVIFVILHYKLLFS